MVEFTGTYPHEKDENTEAIMAKMGMGFVMRKLASKARPTTKVAIEGDTWTITTITPIKTMVWTFKLNEETEVETACGKLKVIFTKEGNTLTQKPVGGTEEKDIVVVREFTEAGIKQTMTHVSSGTVGIRRFKRS